jgi:hypothetical protein
MKRLGVLWEIKLATAQGPAMNTNVSSVPVVFDGDTAMKSATSVIGPVRSSARVVVMLVPPGSAYIIGTIDRNDRNYRTPSFAYKTAIESLANNITPQNDNELFTTLVPNTFHKLEMQLFIVGNSTGQFRLRFTQPSGCRSDFHAAGIHTSVVLGAGTSGIIELFPSFNNTGVTTSDMIVNNSTNLLTINVNGMIRTGANGGTLQLQWAQSVSNATNTSVNAGSWMLTTPVAAR